MAASGSRAGGMGAARVAGAGGASSATVAAQKEKIIDLEAQLQEITDHSVALEKERDFYFSKVRLYHHHTLVLSLTAF